MGAAIGNDELFDVGGLGTVITGGGEIRWNRGDVFAAPTWRWIEHRASEDAVLFPMTDEPLLRFARYYKFEGG